MPRGGGINAVGVVGDPYSSRPMQKAQGTAWSFPWIPIQGPSTTLSFPGQHHLGWTRKAAACSTALSDETQVPPEPEAYVNVWF